MQTHLQPLCFLVKVPRQKVEAKGIKEVEMGEGGDVGRKVTGAVRVETGV